jgi:predicted porin
MKKSLIALAVAGAFAAPAFAATSNVDVYGKLHTSVNFVDDQVAGASDVGISSNASRIGFKGSEDLGGGLAAIWQIETTVNLDEGNASNWASRNSFIGLKGGFGTALIGRHDTPLKLVGRSLDLFGDTMADSRNVLGGGGDARPNNAVAYISPSMSGFTLAGAYATDPGTAAVDRDDMSVYSLSAAYANGPLYLGFGYADGDGLAAAGTDRHWRLGAGFTMGDLKLVAQYDDTKAETGFADYDAWMIGAAYTMGNIVLKANYMDGDIDGTSNDPKQWTIGADYNLSKRTAVYALYADGEYITMGSGAGASDLYGSGVAGGDISIFSVGITHTF